MLTSNQMDATFAALADSTRRAILLRLASGEASVNELAKPFRMSQPAVSKHLKVLERAGLISVGQDAQRRPRRIQPARLAEASAWLERFREFWEGGFWRHAPRRMVFEAMTKPELLKRWMGPRGWELVVSEIELRVGGKWRSVLRSPEGKVLEKFLKRPPLFVCLIQQALTHGSPDVSFAHSVASR